MIIQPESFWASRGFTDALTGLVIAVTGYISVIVGRVKVKQDETAEKVKTIETHTNGMLTALQTKIDVQDATAQHIAELTTKDKQIAQLTKDQPKDVK